MRQGKIFIETILSLVDLLGTILLSISTVGQKQSEYKSDTIIIRLQRQDPAEVGGAEFRGIEGEGGVTFPSEKVLFGSLGANMQSVDTQVSYLW